MAILKMHSTSVLSVLLCCLLLSQGIMCEDEPKDAASDSSEESSEDDEAVLTLTDAIFDETLREEDTLLVEFYAPWCGHCKTLAPKYEEAAKMLKGYEPKITLAKVDATEHSALASRFDVTGYPTLKFFKKGEAYDYEGPRTAEGIVEYMKERAAPDWKPPESVVVVLGNDNFTDFINNNELSLVEFYAPWCGHCKSLAPKYDRAARVLNDRENPIPLAKIDATEAKDIAKQYDITGYPTLKVFRKGREFEYKGKNEEHDIVGYMTRQQGDASQAQATVKDLQASLKKDDVTVVGFFSSQDDDLFLTFMDVANELREEYQFRHTFEADVRVAYKMNAGSVAVLNAERFYTQFEPKWHTYKGDNERAGLRDFVIEKSVPLVGHFNPETSNQRYKDKLPLCLVFYSVDFSFDYRENTQIWRHKIAKVASKYPDITFAIANDEDMSEKVKDCGLETSGEEMNFCIIDKGNKRYPMEPPMEDYEQDEVEEYLERFKAGKLRPWVKSQPVPKKQSGPVTVLVGNNFQKIVNDAKKDVLVEFYAPWCGHCKSLEPKYKKLAKKLKDEKNLVIAKIDATANDYPDTFEVSGFPTIYFVAAEKDAKPVLYEGEREIKGFTEFLKKNAKNSFKGKDEL